MMQTTSTIWQNGKFVPWDDAKIHVLTHTLHYGGGAFEGIRFYETAKGPAIFRLSDHIDRLLYSAAALKMDFPYTKDELIAVIKKLVNINNIKSGYIRPIAFYGYSKMGVNPVGNPVECAIAVWPWGAYLPHESVDIKTSSYIRIHPDSTVVDAKLCGHYVNSILASLEIKGTHYHEALFLDTKKNITEGVGENFFIVKNNTLITPKIGAILAGITRETVIELAQELGYKVKEKNISLPEAYAADEAFFTGTAAEITAIASIDDKRIGSQAIGPITAQIKKSYLDLVHGLNEKHSAYLTYTQDTWKC